jgi:hypothetical protein
MPQPVQRNHPQLDKKNKRSAHFVLLSPNERRQLKRSHMDWSRHSGVNFPGSYLDLNSGQNQTISASPSELALSKNTRFLTWFIIHPKRPAASPTQDYFHASERVTAIAMLPPMTQPNPETRFLTHFSHSEGTDDLSTTQKVCKHR